MEKGLDTIYEKLIYNITSTETQALEKFTMFSRKKYGLTIDVLLMTFDETVTYLKFKYKTSSYQ